MASNTKSPLVIIPTLNERANLEKLLPSLLELVLPTTSTSAGSRQLDILIVDDGSTDGTELFLADLKSTRVNLLSRGRKLGIGSAIRDGLMWAYDHGYSEVVTMDGDGTHHPQSVIDLLDEQHKAAILIGTRYTDAEDKRSQWRIWLSSIAQSLRGLLLNLRVDASNNLRRYRLNEVPRSLFKVAASNSYSFLFETALFAQHNEITLGEIPAPLADRKEGESKLRGADIVDGICQLLKYSLLIHFTPERIKLPLAEFAETQNSAPSEWDSYWGAPPTLVSAVYGVLAKFYRNLLIRPTLNCFLANTFKLNSKLLHAGCGGGGVDLGLRELYQITPLDLSSSALMAYSLLHTDAPQTQLSPAPVLGSVFALPFEDDTFDGVYNLGVMEHFTEAQIVAALKEFKRVIKKDGKILLFWPPEFGFSVRVLKVIGAILKLFKNEEPLFPPEISRVTSKTQIENYASQAGLKVAGYYFGIKDFYTQVAITLEGD